MNVLVVSDTHLSDGARLPAPVMDLAARADAVLHAGDVTDPSVLQALSAVAPTHAVLGNNDHGLTLPETLELDLAGVSVAMVHDSGATAGRGGRMRRRFPSADVVVFGHSHTPLVESSEGVLLVNPGSPTQRRRAPTHTVAWLTLADGRASAEIVHL